MERTRSQNEWMNSENSAERARRYKEQAGEIRQHYQAWGSMWETMDRYDIRCVSTFKRIVGDGNGRGHDEARKVPATFDPSLFASDDSLYDSIVTAFLRRLQRLEAQVSLLQAALAFRDADMERLEEEKLHWKMRDREKEYTVVTQLLARINTA